MAAPGEGSTSASYAYVSNSVRGKGERARMSGNGSWRPAGLGPSGTPTRWLLRIRSTASQSGRSSPHPGAVVVGVVHVAEKRDCAVFAIEQRIERLQHGVLLCHPVERLRHHDRRDRTESGGEAGQIVGAAENEREVVDPGFCGPSPPLLDHRLLRIHHHHLADERRQPQRDVRRPRSEIEHAIGRRPPEMCGEQPGKRLGRAIPMLGVEAGRVLERSLTRLETRPSLATPSAQPSRRP